MAIMPENPSLNADKLRIDFLHDLPLDCQRLPEMSMT